MLFMEDGQYDYLIIFSEQLYPVRVMLDPNTGPEVGIHSGWVGSQAKGAMDTRLNLG